MIELNKIYNEDCIQGMKRIPDCSIDAIICDLPYGSTKNEWDKIVPINELWSQYKRVIKPNGAIVLFGQEPFSTKLRSSNLDWYRYDWIWAKNAGGGFLNANKRPLKYFENIIVFYNAQSTYNPQGLISVNRFHKRRGKTGVGSNYGNTVNEYVKKYENYPIDILYFDKEIGQTFHPTQKPVDLIRYLISTYTNEGETVLDNCIGSGTTAIAAIREHRNFIGFEINEEYFQKAKERIHIEISNPTL